MVEPGAVEAHYRDEIPLPEGDRYALRRREAVEEFFRSGGFPTAAQEDWRFSNLDALGRTAFRRYPEITGLRLPEPADLPAWTSDFEHQVLLAEGSPLNAADFRAGNGLVFGDLPIAPSRDEADDWGFVAAGDVPGGAQADLEAPLRHPLELVNAGLFDCGFRVRVGRDEDAGPLLLYSLRRESGHPHMLHPRSVIELAPGSRLTVVEAHDGASETAGWTNPSTLCRVGENAELRYVRVELETGKVAHTGRVTFHLARNARVHSTVLSLTGGRSRTDTAAILTAEGAEVDLDGLFLGVNAAKADQHILAIHAARHTTSRQLFKNVLADEATAVFDGKVVVAPGAIGTDASQANRNLLLSDKAAVHTRPRLEINADDVKCAHGAAIGKLDEDALFYLRSRGLGRMDSREILVRGFAGEVVEKVPMEAIRGLAKDGLTRVRESRGFAA
jgi:Fe-S cluster assembly protein SufD